MLRGFYEENVRVFIIRTRNEQDNLSIKTLLEFRIKRVKKKSCEFKFQKYIFQN